MYDESWGLKRICPMCSKQYYDLGRTELECPECGKEIEVTTMSRPRRGRKPGSTNAAPLTNPIPPKAKEKDDDLDIENLDLDNTDENLEDDAVLIEDESDIDPAVDVGIKPNEVPAVNLECKPGDLVCFDRRIKHASFGGGTHRRMFTMIFEPRYPDDELEALRSIIGLNEGFLAKRAYGDIMINTADPKRMVHLEQRLANDSHLNNRPE